MPLFLIERNFAEALQIDESSEAEISRVNEQEGIDWLYSFLSADRKKTYCLYQSANADAIRRAAERLNLPADVILEVDRVGPGSAGSEDAKASSTRR